MINLPKDLEESCLAILDHPRATWERKRLAAETLRDLGLGDNKGLLDNGEDQFFDPDHFEKL